MTILQIERAEDYLRYVQQDKDEAEVLFKDLLIGVTNFFRDPEAFEALDKTDTSQAVHRKIGGRDAQDLGMRVLHRRRSVFDCQSSFRKLSSNRQAPYESRYSPPTSTRRPIEHARAGVYPASITSDISQQRLAHFFEQLPGEGGYQPDFPEYCS